MTPTHPLCRRAFLRGVGVTMALPWLESVPVWGDDKPRNSSSEPPVRFAVLFAGNGFHSREWWAKGEGKGMQVGKVLEPLHPFREKMLFLRGLYNEEALIGGIHSCQTGNLLTGAHLAPGGEIKSGISCDQVIAERMKPGATPPMVGKAVCDRKDAMVFWSSGRAPSRPTKATKSPRSGKIRLKGAGYRWLPAALE